MIDSTQVNAFAAVEPFPGDKIGWQARTHRRRADVQASVIAGDMIVDNRHERRIRDQDALKVCVSDGESGDRHVVQSRTTYTVDIDAVGQGRRIDGAGS